MKFEQPSVHVIGTTSLQTGYVDMLREIGVSEEEWDVEGSDTDLIEIAGRLCYKSFGSEAGSRLNKNISKTREGNAEYLYNILKSHHGSVLEHQSVSIAFINVSRVFTHEIVRHRVGTGFSQESLRYVRFSDIKMRFPNTLAVGGEREQMDRDWETL